LRPRNDTEIDTFREVLEEQIEHALDEFPREHVIRQVQHALQAAGLPFVRLRGE
jgi:hypothetical protein